MQTFREKHSRSGMCKGPANRLCKFKVQKEVTVVRGGETGRCFRGAEVEGWTRLNHEGPAVLYSFVGLWIFVL